jgi:hypothetical protein
VARFLFRFGFCTPAQWSANEAHGWDDESSEAFFVESDSREDALSWGCEVAESFTRSLFESAGSGEIPSWAEADFAYWIEEDPEAVLSSQALERIPIVRSGEMPTFSRWQGPPEGGA